MTATLVWSTTLVRVECCTCGVMFGVPQDLDRANHADSDRWFFCPNGHRQHYTKTTEQILREKLEREERWRKGAETSARASRDQAQAAERRASAYKGQATRLRKRAAAGVCPCCTRTFQNVARHMERQHPEFPGSEDD